MTVKTLIEKLQQLPPDTLVLRGGQEWFRYYEMVEINHPQKVYPDPHFARAWQPDFARTPELPGDPVTAIVF